MSEGNILRETITLVKSNPLLWSREAAFLALVRSAEAAALFASPDCGVAALRAWELYRPFSRQYHTSTPVAAGHSNGANFCQH